MSPKRIVLRFMAGTADRPIIYHLIKNYDLVVNILKARINPKKEGTMVLELQGEPEKYKLGLEYLRSQGISIQPLSQDVKRNENLCVHCGACTSVCPSGALFLERPEMTVKFDEDKCVVCHMCVKACPYKAMEVCF
ncbi:MAG: L-aspartate semialdehyde sulfurtransferase ferredoxin [Clostridia bacterium]|nr:L-aspartate semialdehyde sulfurtransferase ferredoxin [Clostridia bacterium]